MVRRRTLGALVAGVALAIGLLGAAASTATAKAAAAHPALRHHAVLRSGIAPSASGGEILCEDKGAGSLCITNKNGVMNLGNPISGSLFTGNPNQHWHLVQNGFQCNHGFVSSSMACPFAPGSGLNAQFNNDAITKICLNANTAECVAAPNGVAHLEGADSSGTDFIIAGFALVNRLWSDNNGQAGYLTTDESPGDTLLLDPAFVEGSAQWGQP